MSISEDQALGVLSEIRDPISDRDIVAAGRLANLKINGGIVQAVLEIPPPEADKFFPIRDAAQAALEALDGVESAKIILSAHKPGPKLGKGQKRNPHGTSRPDGVQGDRHVKTILAVSSAKGGVGKSTLAVNLAAALKRSGLAVGLLDADIHGPSLPSLMGTKGRRTGTKEVTGAEGQSRPLIRPVVAHDIPTMSIGYLTPDDGPVIWRGPMVQGAISRMLWDVEWGALDLLIIDMPPGTGDAQLGLANDIKPAGAVVVTTPQDLALLDATKGAMMFAKVEIPVLGLIENMAVFVCPDCGSAHHIFGEGGAKREAEALGLEYLGAAPLHIDIRESGDKGHPIAFGSGAVAEIFQSLAAKIQAKL